MSHTSRVQVQIRSLDAIEAAASTMGYRLLRGCTRFAGYYPAHEQENNSCSHVLSDGMGLGEIGLVDSGDGVYSLAYDKYRSCRFRPTEDRIGVDGSILMARYALHAAQEAASAQGWVSEMDETSLTIYHPDGGTFRIDGRGVVDAQGFSGAGCMAPGELLAAALGHTLETVPKPELYEEHLRA